MARALRAVGAGASFVLALVAVGACGGSEFQGSSSSASGGGGIGATGGGGHGASGSGADGGAGCSDEICDGADNDCDGEVDELPPKTCGRGECENTVAACEGGEDAVCEPKPGGREVCDGKDNDCDGETDESDPAIGAECSTGRRGVCDEGTKQCRGGDLVCVADAAKPETCNLIDDDCNGEVDDGIVGGGCATGLLGVCGPGTLHCVGGNMVCQPDTMASVETCDGLDNDCDGSSDDGDPGAGVACDTGQSGVCKPGTTACTSGDIECNANVAPSPEACNNKDDDCDGSTDENNPGGGAACNTGLPGECAIGVLTCASGSLGCVQTKLPVAETCNNKDDDCDGTVDEGNPGGGNACNTGMPGVCSAGTNQCQGGSVVCVPNTEPLPSEICGNGLDDDCSGAGDPPGIVTYFFDGFDQANAKGWLLGTEWQIGPATGSMSSMMGFFGDPDTDHSPTANDNLAGMVIGGDVTSNVHPVYALTSPVINTSGAAGNVWLTYYRWLNADYDPFVSSTVDVFNGISWVNVWKSPQGVSIADGEWFEHVIDITPHKAANMRIRFGYQVLQQGAFSLSGWNVDDVQVLSAPCP